MRRIKPGSQERTRGNTEWDEHFAAIVGNRRPDEAATKSGRFSLEGFEAAATDTPAGGAAAGGAPADPLDEAQPRAPSPPAVEPRVTADPLHPAADEPRAAPRRMRLEALPLRLPAAAGGVALMVVVVGAVGIAATLLALSPSDDPAAPPMVAEVPMRPPIVRETAQARLPTLAEVLAASPEQAPRPLPPERPAVPAVPRPVIEPAPPPASGPGISGPGISGPVAWIAEAPVPDAPVADTAFPDTPAPGSARPEAVPGAQSLPAAAARPAEPPISLPAEPRPDAVTAADVAEARPPGEPPTVVAAADLPPRPDPSPRVITVQRALLRDGIDPGPVDGLFGPRTREAVRVYQARVGMEPTGAIDAALLRRLASAEPPPAGSADAAGSEPASTEPPRAEPLRAEPLRAEPLRAEPMIEIPRHPAPAARQQAMARPDSGPAASPPSPDRDPDPDGYGLVEALGDLFGLPQRAPVLASRRGPDGPGGGSGSAGDAAGGGSSGGSGAGSDGGASGGGPGADAGGSDAGNDAGGTSDSGGSGSSGSGSSGSGGSGSGGSGSGGSGSGDAGAGAGSGAGSGGSAGGTGGDGDAADSGDDSGSGGIGGAVGGAVGGGGGNGGGDGGGRR